MNIVSYHAPLAALPTLLVPLDVKNMVVAGAEAAVKTLLTRDDFAGDVPPHVRLILGPNSLGINEGDKHAAMRRLMVGVLSRIVICPHGLNPALSKGSMHICYTSAIHVRGLKTPSWTYLCHVA